MNEYEIIKRLKDNKRMGTSFYFLPEPVRDYLLIHGKEKDRFLVFDETVREWKLSPDGISCLDCSLYALPNFKPLWEEFEINKEEGKFRIIKGDVADANYYDWWDWQSFLSDKKEYNYFGGWLFSGSWELSLNITDSKGRRLHSYLDLKKDDIEPVVPTKIRFWRFKE